MKIYWIDYYWSITYKPRCFFIHMLISLFNIQNRVLFLLYCSYTHVSYCAIEKQWVFMYSLYIFYVWMIVLCPFIWIVFYTLPQHLPGQLSVQFVFVLLNLWMPSTGMSIYSWTSSMLLNDKKDSVAGKKKRFQKTISLLRWLQ